MSLKKLGRPESVKRRLSGGVPARYMHVGSLMMLGTVAGALALGTPERAHAFNLYSGSYGSQNLEINLDTTLEYSTFMRIDNPSTTLAGPGNANGNEGDDDFRHGVVENVFEALPVFDLKYGPYGVHVSGEAFIDPNYLEKNQNNEPGTFNPYSTASNRDFTSATRNNNGENAKVLDAFVYGSQAFGADQGQEVTFRFGRSTLLWGQSLFFPENGIAAGQAPLDATIADSVPGAEAQQIFLPVGQAILTYQPNEILTFQAYYQFQWQPDTLEGVGSYFSSSDVLDKGGQRLIAGPDLYLYRVKNLNPPAQNGQFGVAAEATLGNYDLGLYALRFDAKAPELYTSAPQPSGGPGNIGSYYLVYPRDIQIFGGAVSTTLGPANVAAEVSGRRNMPLDSGAAGIAVYPGSANAGALYAVGSTWAAQTSFIYVTPPVPIDPGGITLDGEFAMNHVLSVDSGKALLAPGRDNTAGQFEVVATPAYFNVFPNTELEFPISFSYNLFGRSQINGQENHGTGSVSAGITVVYRSTWTAGLVYNDYIGAANPTLNPVADRSYLNFNIEHTF
jgi:hypothetical protein